MGRGAGRPVGACDFPLEVAALRDESELMLLAAILRLRAEGTQPYMRRLFAVKMARPASLKSLSWVTSVQPFDLQSPARTRSLKSA